VLFVHVGVREAKTESMLSPFILGKTGRDPVSGEKRSFSEMERRISDYSVLLNTQCRGRSGPGTQSVSSQANVAEQFYCEVGQPNNLPGISPSGLERGYVRAGGPLH
jgi:hypothetical protein